MLRIDADLDYVTDLLPALLVFSLGLAATVAPLTATVLADADESNAGIASGVNNAIARVAGLLAVAAIGAVVAAQFNSALDDSLAGQTLSPPAQAAVDAGAQGDARERRSRRRPACRRQRRCESASDHAFHVGIGICDLARGARRRARPGRHPQPAPRPCAAGLPGRPVRGPAARLGPRAAGARRGSGAALGLAS